MKLSSLFLGAILYRSCISRGGVVDYAKTRTMIGLRRLGDFTLFRLELVLEIGRCDCPGDKSPIELYAALVLDSPLVNRIIGPFRRYE